MIETKKKEGFEFIDDGEGENLLLLHGLFGALSNWETVVNEFKKDYRVLIPVLPIYTLPVREAGLTRLNKFVEEFVETMGLSEMHIMGNSLGGHIGLIFTLANQEKVSSLTLTGSSGLFENSMGGSYPKRGNYDYIDERVRFTFYNPETAAKELVDEVFQTMQSIKKSLSIVAIAKSAQRHNMAGEITSIKIPTLLIWGLNDTITPPAVAHEFNRLIPNSILKFVDECCHAPMMEHPEKFNKLLKEFLIGLKNER